MADGKITIDTSINGKGFEKGLSAMKNQTNGLTAVVKKLGAVLASVFAVRAIADFGKECVELGSNVAEVQNVVDVAFGDMAYKIESFAETSIRNFGMSRLAAKKTASTYMAMARGMGVDEKAASDMAIGLAGLTGDVASFYNVSQELADVKLKSVFTGETESLKDIGVVMTQTNLKAYALTQGISKSMDAMSQAELVALRYGFVMEQLELAQGDFARTSDSWANQTRILSMQWQEFMSIIGQALISVLTPLVKTLNTIVSALINMANTINTVVSGIFGGTNSQIQQTQDSAAGVGSAIDESVGNQNALTDATKKTNKEQKKSEAVFDKINKIGSSSGGAASDGAGATAGAVGGVPATVQTVSVETEGSQQILAFFEELRNAVQPVTDALGRLWDKLKLVGTFTGDALIDFYETFLKPVGQWVMGEGLPRFIDAISVGLGSIDWQRINDALHTLWVAVEPFAINVGEGLLWLWENVLVPFGAWTMNEVVPRFLNIMADVIEILNEIIEAAKPALLWLWDTFLKPLAEFTGGIILTILDEFHGWLEIIAGILTGDFDRAVAGAKEVVQALADRFTLVKDFALAAWEGIKEVFSTIAAWFSEHIITPVTNSFKGFINGLIGMVEGFINFFVRGINRIIDAVNSLSFDVPDILGGGTIGFNLPNVSEIKLPRLARGAVIPPNREFMAVLGDQKSGTNIEAPEALIRRIVREETAGRGGSGDQTVILEVDKQQLGKVVYKLNKAESRRIGLNLVEV